MSFLNEFKQFVMRGNVVDLAIAVIIGTAFGKIISSLVDGIIMPLIGLLLGGVNIAENSFKLGNAVVKWGLFLQSIVDFMIIGLSIFVAVKLINMFQKQQEAQPPQKTNEEMLLTEIRDLLKQDKIR